MAQHNWIFIVAPLIFGVVIGWITFYFIRLYKEYTVQNLLKTVSVFIGGVGFCSILFAVDSDIAGVSLMYYLLGCAIGFILHLIYQLIISISFRHKFCRTWDQYVIMSSCNIPAEDREIIRRNGINATRLVKCFDLLEEGKISEEDFVEYIKSCPITKTEYDRMCQVDEQYFLLTDRIITYIDAKGLCKYFKD